MSHWLRLTILTGVLTAGILLLFASTFYFVLQRNLWDEIDHHLQERAELMRRALISASIGEHGTMLPEPPPLEEFTTPGIYAELHNQQGTVRATSPNVPGQSLPITSAMVAPALEGGELFGTVTVGSAEELRFMAVGVEHPLAGREVLIVAESLEPAQRILRQVRTLLLIGGVGGLTLVLAGTAFLTWRGFAPIRQVTKIAERVVATGQYQERVPATMKKDETGHLTRVFNELIATVEQTLAQQRQFLADTSHELRSPLTVVLANLDLLRRHMPLAEQKESILEATAEAQRMRRLVSNLLLLAHADATEVMVMEPVCFNKIVSAEVERIERIAPNHAIHPQMDDHPLVLMGDAERLSQVVRNLLENAVQHTPPRTNVAIHVRQMNRYIHCVVNDIGPGIPAHQLPLIWNRFYRGDAARSRETGGSGLGLAIVKYLVEAHHGQVSVQSRAGEGTTFTLIFPLHVD